ncbi:MAG: DUF6691 family protein [Gammaproteobacteria bacterium]
MLPLIMIFLAGIIFSLGLGIAGMTQPEKVIGFLDVMGNWDPSLAVVLVSAVVTFFIGQKLIMRRTTAFFGERFQLPTRTDLDSRLIGGAIIFGIGWGLIGLCPGPALVSSISGDGTPLTFIMSMAVGMYLFEALHLRYSEEPDGGAGPLDAPATSK